MRTALCITLEQITHGETACLYCGEDASVMIATGADPAPEPMCWTHARMHMDGVTKLGDQLFANKSIA